MKKKKDEKISLQNLSFYFDGVERDQWEHGSASWRNAQVLQLRHKLLKLNPQDFSTMMDAISGMVDQVLSQRGLTEVKPEDRRRNAQVLYAESSSVGSADLKVGAV